MPRNFSVAFITSWNDLHHAEESTIPILTRFSRGTQFFGG